MPKPQDHRTLVPSHFSMLSLPSAIAKQLVPSVGIADGLSSLRPSVHIAARVLVDGSPRHAALQPCLLGCHQGAFRLSGMRRCLV